MNYKLETMPGNNFQDVAKTAKQTAKEKGTTVEFEFNEVLCVVDKNTNLGWLYRDYSNSWTMQWKKVGPDCVENYSEDVQTEFEKRRKIEKEKQAKQQAEWKTKDAKEKKEFEAKVIGIELELSDKKGWNKSRKANSDGYGRAALDYAEGWAKLMQIEISKGKTITECYDYTQNGLGFLGITGFQFGCAVSVLSQTWKYGLELKKAHNAKYGITGKVEGTVNPAILSVGVNAT